MSVELPVSVINGRFKVSEKPLVAPGKCACCGAVDRPVVDFGFDLEFYGTVLMCGDCMREALGVHDSVYPPQESQAQVVPLPTIDAGELNAHLRAAANSIDSLISILPDVFSPVSSEQGEPTGAGETGATVHGESTTSDNPLLKLINESGPDDNAGPKHSIFGAD